MLGLSKDIWPTIFIGWSCLIKMLTQIDRNHRRLSPQTNSAPNSFPGYLFFPSHGERKENGDGNKKDPGNEFVCASGSHLSVNCGCNESGDNFLNYFHNSLFAS